MPSSHLILCRPILLLPSIFSSIRVFSNEFFASGGQKYCRFSFSISPSNEYSGLISFRIDWLDLLVVQGTLKSLLQHHHSLLDRCKSKLLQLDIISHHSEWPSLKSLQTISAGEGVHKRERSCTVGQNVNLYSHCGRWYGYSLKN